MGYVDSKTCSRVFDDDFMLGVTEHRLFKLSVCFEIQVLSSITRTRPGNKQRFFTPIKMTIFILIFFTIFIFARNIDCGYTLEPPQ